MQGSQVRLARMHVWKHTEEEKVPADKRRMLPSTPNQVRRQAYPRPVGSEVGRRRMEIRHSRRGRVPSHTLPCYRNGHRQPLPERHWITSSNPENAHKSHAGPGSRSATWAPSFSRISIRVLSWTARRWIQRHWKAPRRMLLLSGAEKLSRSWSEKLENKLDARTEKIWSKSWTSACCRRTD